jgi:hypothetical protein
MVVVYGIQNSWYTYSAILMDVTISTLFVIDQSIAMIKRLKSNI